MTENDKQIGFALFALGALMLLGNLSDNNSAWVWPAGIGAAFLFAYRRTKQPSLAIPGAILTGLAAGILLENLLNLGGSTILLGMAAGFYLLPKIEKTHTWATWPALALAGVAGLNFISNNPWLASFILIAGIGLFLWTQKNKSTNTTAPVLTTKTQTVNIQTATTHMAEQSLFDKLSEWRNTQSKTKKTEPQDLLSDMELDAIAYAKPQDMPSLGNYLNKTKLELYGNKILEVIRKYDS